MREAATVPIAPLQKIPNQKFWDLDEGTSEQGGRSAELFLYGTIVDEESLVCEGYTPKALVEGLNALGNVDEINCHIFSNGGDVFAGNAIYALLKQRRETVNIYIEGIAASIASVIAMAGDNVYISKTAMMMVHNPMIFMFGMFNRIDMERVIPKLNQACEVLVAAYAEKTGQSPEQIHALLDANQGDGTYLTATDAISMGFADAITPNAKEPLQMAAMIRPNVYACRGREIDMSIYKNPPQLAVMEAKKGRKKMAKSKARIRASLESIECPYCHTVCDLDTSSGIVSPKPEEDATVAVPMDDKRTKAVFSNSVFKITCPSCSGEFEYDTDPTPDTGVTVVETGGGAALTTQAKRTAKIKSVKAQTPVVNEPTAAPENNVVPITCTECGTDFEIDVDPALVEVTAECPNCGAEITVDTSSSGDAPADPASIPAAATSMQNGILAERKRLSELDEAARAFPQFSNAIEGFKRNGTTVACAHKWIFKAVASQPQQGNPGYLAAVRKDAAVLDKVARPAKGNDLAAKISEQFESLAKMRGVAKRG